MQNHIALSLETKKDIVDYGENLYKCEQKDVREISFSRGTTGNVDYVSFYGQEKTVFAIKPYQKKFLNRLMLENNFELDEHRFCIPPIAELFVGDLLYAKGGVFDLNEIHVAVFLPYFAQCKRTLAKKSFVFANLMEERFVKMAQSTMQKFSMNLKLTSQDFANWVSLHEGFHNSGPLPLFSGKVNKFSKKSYGFVEELRVDLSIIYFILNCIPSEGRKSLINVVCLVIADRVFRAARFHFNTSHAPRHNMYAKMVEGDAAICLLCLLVHNELLDLPGRKFVFCSKKLSAAIKPVLKDIYDYEKSINNKDSFYASEPSFCKYLRQKYFKLNAGVRLYLEANSCTNCTYELVFRPV